MRTLPSLCKFKFSFIVFFKIIVACEFPLRPPGISNEPPWGAMDISWNDTLFLIKWTSESDNCINHLLAFIIPYYNIFNVKIYSNLHQLSPKKCLS